MLLRNLGAFENSSESVITTFQDQIDSSDEGKINMKERKAQSKEMKTTISN